MAQALKREFDEAEARGRALAAEEPTALSASFDSKTARIVVELTDGRSYAFPPGLVQDLAGADQAELSEIVVDGAGLNLHIPRLDVDLFVPALVAGVFGTRRFAAQELARHAGRAKSPAKAATSRANGVKGGRPKTAK
jgi:hypothetical protein